MQGKEGTNMCLIVVSEWGNKDAAVKEMPFPCAPAPEWLTEDQKVRLFPHTEAFVTLFCDGGLKSSFYTNYADGAVLVLKLQSRMFLSPTGTVVQQIANFDNGEVATTRTTLQECIIKGDLDSFPEVADKWLVRQRTKPFAWEEVSRDDFLCEWIERVDP